MKKLLLSITLALSFFSLSHAQCSVEVNDSLLSTYDYVLNAINPTGTGPFSYTWNVSDGNGMPIPYNTSASGDSITIDAATLENNYGCVIYQLCMTDMMGCMTCVSDTGTVAVPFNCYSQFTSSIVGPNQVSITLSSSMPPYLINNQMAMWTDGNGQGQGVPYMGPGTIIDYTPGSSNTSNKFFLCILTNMVNGGCISCDSIPYTNSGLGLNELKNSMLHISPNPASSKATISCTSEIEALQIYNSVGQVVAVDYTIGHTTAQLNMTELPKGIYIVRVSTISGTFEERLVKE